MFSQLPDGLGLASKALDVMRVCCNTVTFGVTCCVILSFVRAFHVPRLWCSASAVLWLESKALDVLQVCGLLRMVCYFVILGKPDISLLHQCQPCTSLCLLGS